MKASKRTLLMVAGSPARDSSHKIDWEPVLFADGTELRGGNTEAGEREQQLRDLDKRPRRPNELPESPVEENPAPD